MLHNFRRTGVRVWTQFSAGVDRGIDPRVDVVANDGAELAAPGIDERIADH